MSLYGGIRIEMYQYSYKRVKLPPKIWMGIRIKGWRDSYRGYYYSISRCILFHIEVQGIPCQGVGYSMSRYRIFHIEVQDIPYRGV